MTMWHKVPEHREGHPIEVYGKLFKQRDSKCKGTVAGRCLAHRRTSKEAQGLKLKGRGGLV